jgi:hypothetical protein
MADTLIVTAWNVLLPGQGAGGVPRKAPLGVGSSGCQGGGNRAR